MNKKSWLILTIICSATFAFAQDNNQILKVYFDNVRKGNYPAIPKPLSLPENAKSTLAVLPIYLKDTLSEIRFKAYTVLHVVGDNSQQPHIREAVMTKLIEACKDKDSGNAGIALDYLKAYKQNEFTSQAKDSIRILFKLRVAHFEKLLKIIGFIDLKDLTEPIKSLTQPGTPQSTRWAALIALTRMGDLEATNDMMRRVKKLPINDDVIYKIFPDLVYTRNPEAINYMIETMKSNEKNCASSDDENEQPIPCGYRIMEQLAPAIENYPLTLDQSGDIKTKDYTAALNTVCSWFDKHKDFKIRQDNF